MAGKAKDRTGHRFGRLVALRRAGTNKTTGNAIWRCRCDCGQEVEAPTHSLVAGATISCGCANTRPRTHGMTHTPTYRSWKSMHRRCKPEYHDARYYADRGFVVCERWKSFENFYEDMGERPAGRTLDRRDNDLGYEPGNCRWATPKEQVDNRRPRSVYRHATTAAVTELKG